MSAWRLEYSDHGTARCQQRGIPREAVSLIYQCGVPRHTGDALSYSLNKSSRQQIRGSLPRSDYARLSKYLDYYLVVAADRPVLMTVARRLKRPKW